MPPRVKRNLGLVKEGRWRSSSTIEKKTKTKTKTKTKNNNDNTPPRSGSTYEECEREYFKMTVKQIEGALREKQPSDN